MEQYERMAVVAQKIAHPIRLGIILLLCRQKELTVTELTQALDQKQTAISQHLQQMKLHGFLKAQRKGKFVCYHLINPQIFEVIQVLQKVT